MENGAATLGGSFDRLAVDRALAEVGGRETLRVRLTLALDGVVAMTAAPLKLGPSEWTVVIAKERLRANDPWLLLKTSERAVYDTVRAGLPAGVDEAVLLNERGEVCDGTVTTVFVDRGQGLETPALASGLLPGVLRAELLAQGKCRESVLRASDLASGRVWVGNSLRGLIPARLAWLPADLTAAGRRGVSARDPA